MAIAELDSQRVTAMQYGELLHAALWQSHQALAWEDTPTDDKTDARPMPN